MKKLSLLSSIAILMMGILMLPSCSDDDPVITLEPDVSLTYNGGDVAPGEEFTLTLTAREGDNPMNLLTITEDGTTIDLSRFGASYEGSANPAALLGANTTSINWSVPIMAPATPGTYTYTATVRDDGSNTGTSSVDVTVAGTPPSISIDGSTSIEVEPGENRIVNLTAARGTSPMSTLSVYQDGVLIDVLDKLEFNGVGFTSPLTLEGADKEGFSSADVLLRMLPDVPADYVYTFEVEDELGETGSVDLNVKVNPLPEVTMIMLSNDDGQEFGGVDLQNGVNVSSNDAAADIEDMGIDTDLPVPQNWLQQIRPINGSTLRLPDTGSPELFNYDNIQTRDALVAAYDSGIDANETDKLAVDDLFLVRSGDDYFIIKITNITVTPGDNNDFYELSIKQALN